MRLVDRDPGPFNTVVLQADIGDPLGQRLDQVDRLALHRGLDRGHETSVVDGVAQVVRGGGRGGVDTEREVEHEGLPLALLVLQDAVVGEALDAQDGDLVDIIVAALPAAEAVLALDESRRVQPLAALYRAAPLRRVLAELEAGSGDSGGAGRAGRAGRAGEHPAPPPLASLPLRAITARMVVETIAAPPGSTADVDTLDDAAALGVTVPRTTEGDRTL